MTEPKIRFKRDDGSSFPDWEEIAFDSLYEPLNNNTYSRDCLNYESGKAKNIHYGDILVKFGEICDVQKEKLPFVNDGNAVQKYVSLQDGDIVLADTAEDETVGKAIEMHNVNGENVISGLHTMACRPRLSFAPKYLGYYMNSSSYHSQLKPYMQGIKVTSIGRKNIAETMISYPTDEREQQKIADFLSNVDEVIAASEEEVANLEQQKKAMMQKIFSQEVRFKKPDGSEFPEWEEKEMRTIATVLMGQSPSGDSVNDDKNGVPLVQGKADILGYGIIPERYTSSPTKISEATDIIMTVRAPVGFVAKLGFSACIGRGVCAIRPNNCADYIFYVLQSKESEWKHIEQGSTFTAVNSDDVSSLIVPFPCLEEQQLIADFFTSFDEAITAAKQELESWKLLKKGLLQKMFV